MIGMAMVFSNAAVFGKWIFLAGIIGFGATVFFQLVNLPVEFDASARPRRCWSTLASFLDRIALCQPRAQCRRAHLCGLQRFKPLLTLAYYIFRLFRRTRDQ